MTKLFTKEAETILADAGERFRNGEIKAGDFAHNPDLREINPFQPGLPESIKKAIVTESVENLTYFVAMCLTGGKFDRNEETAEISRQ